MNIEFKNLTYQDVIKLMPYFKATKLHISDYSAAFKFMWQKHFSIDFAFVDGCAVFRENYQGKTYFHYPMELEEGAALRAIDSIEAYCSENNVRIHFTCIPREKLMELIDRYGMELRLTNKRRWKDYLYNAQDFVTYSGKKFSGQRNHVNKFKKLYPEFKFINLSGNDRAEMFDFLKRFESRQLAKGTVMAQEELESVYDILPHIDEFELVAGALKVENKIVALSIGEICGDQLIIHVEKALTEYEGVYPTMAQEFAKHNVTDKILYINREDDAGDAGLRKSKLQYNPVCLVDKYDLFPRRVIDRLTHIPYLRSERLSIKEITDVDAMTFYRLEFDEERNKYWGYNWREHTDKSPTPEYFMQGIREDFKNREEVPMGIFLGNALIGEVVLHNFGYRNDCEIGVRLLPEYEGFGYAKEALLTVADYAFYEINIETLRAKCYKQNARSRSTLLSAGMRECGEDETYFFFRKTAAN